mgnify:CR=1 FL=1
MPLDNYRGYGDFDLCDPRTVTSSKCSKWSKWTVSLFGFGPSCASIAEAKNQKAQSSTPQTLHPSDIFVYRFVNRGGS